MDNRRKQVPGKIFKKNWRGKANYYRGRGNYKVINQEQAEFSQAGDLNLLETEVVSTPAVILDSDLALGPYMSWKSYFPLELYNETSETAKKLQISQKYLLNVKDQKKAEIEANNSFTIEVSILCSDSEFVQDWPEFLFDLKNSPKNVINYFGLAMHHLLSAERVHELSDPDFMTSENLDDLNYVPVVHARFTGFEILPLKNLKTNTYKKFVSVKGTVVRVGNVKPLCIKLAFQCNKCFTKFVVLQPEGNYSAPTTCIVKQCHSHSFQPLRKSAMTELVPWQSIRLQEMADCNSSDKGRVPRTVECELTRDLVDRCVPGDIVTLSGIVKVSDPKQKCFGAVRSKSTYILYILVNSIECLKEKKDSHEVMPGGLQLDICDLYGIKEIHAQEKLFRLIVSSLCPNIYGHEIVKAGLVLSLFGGTHSHDNNNRVPVRGDSHVLIVGDPGLGKSHMLLACANISPRGVYVCGNTTTSSGLTVTVTKEASGENGLDAGALILADQGCCCIDEFDKMSNQHHALLEAMEQQTISIAKGGMSCILPARTSIIAAANPVGGHYNKAKTVSENIKLGSALLSRFDLVFIIVDKVDVELDSKLSAHVMAMHTGKTNATLSQTVSKRNSLSSQSGSLLSLLHEKNQLVENLQFEPWETVNVIPPKCLRKYIAYARKYVQPKLSPEAVIILQNFYVELRKQHQNPHSTPITNRQLESMIRLTQARARVELREICSEADAQEVISIMKHSMVDTYSDEFGNIDFERSIHGSGMSKRSKAKTFLSRLSAVAIQTDNSFFTVQQMESIAKDAGLETAAFGDFIENLNNQGYLIKKGPKLYKLQTL